VLLDLQPVDPGASQSPALQAYRILERAIGPGVLPPGSRLPSERALSDRLGVSRSTLRQVLGALADSELIEASPQRGWYITDGPITDPPNALVSFTESARNRGIRAGAKVLSHTVRPITLHEQDELHAAPGAMILDLKRLRTLDDTPVCVDRSAVVIARVPGIEDVDFTDNSLYASFANAGVRPARSDYEVHADGADDETATLLEISIGAPVLVGRELSHSSRGDRLLLSHLVYRADAYTFRATIHSR
jgi:DNA-binding GntR family transcriptional regulator